MTLAEFLLARIEEDEQIALYAPEYVDTPGWSPDAVSHLMRWAPNRVMEECRAKRRIVELGEYARTAGDIGLEVGLLVAQEVLASVYRLHPDYREDWRTGRYDLQ